ncbi:MAG: hypothetical protein CXT78_08890 [Thaumarchaeota archaeon]|nr:MAG: hypothetical protein CXT78_08890 [Nitrososphaerota archaeon]
MSLHIFIIWKNARYMTDKILEDIKKQFELLEVYEVHWSTEFFSDNMSRFYGVKLPPGKAYSKANQHEFGPFLLCILEDKNPKYNYVETPNGEELLVNINTYDAKQTYREWTGGGNNVHSSNTEEETEHDLVLLLGKNLKDVRNNLSEFWNEQIKKIDYDLIGFNGWKNLKQLFYVLNATTNYIVLRNFEEFPDTYTFENHEDIDILTNEFPQIEFIVNKQKPSNERPYVNIGDQKVLFDFREPGDGYYDETWSNDILNCKVLSSGGFYVPNTEDYFYSLLYHMLIHKGKLLDDYTERLWLLASKLKIHDVVKKTFSNYHDLKIILDRYQYFIILKFQIL